jgi:hypothetical protein
MSKQKKNLEIREMIQTNGENLDFFVRREIPANLTREQLRERFFKPEYFASDLHDKSVPELKQILADLKKLSNNEPLSRTEFEKLFTASGFVPPVISDELLAKLEMRELHGSYINDKDLKAITDEIERLQKIEK